MPAPLARCPQDLSMLVRAALAAERREISSYCRLFILLRREGEPSGINRIHRIYRKEGLAVRKRRARRKAVDVRVPIREAERALVARLRL
jgi:putative transposase